MCVCVCVCGGGGGGAVPQPIIRGPHVTFYQKHLTTINYQRRQASLHIILSEVPFTVKTPFVNLH